MPGISGWIDVYTPAGLKTGKGPITTALGWDQTVELNAIGRFTTRIPIADERTETITRFSELRYFAMTAAGPQLRGVGIVKTIRKSVYAGQTVIEFSGPGVGEELSRLLLRDVLLGETREMPAARVIYTSEEYGNEHMEAAYDDDLTTTYYISDGEFKSGTGEFGNEERHYIYVGFEQPFYSVEFIFGTIPGHRSTNDVKSTLHAQFLQIFATAPESGWVELDGLADGTSGLNGSGELCTWRRTGVVTWDTDQINTKSWAQINHSQFAADPGDKQYWVRFYVGETQEFGDALSDMDFAEVRVNGDAPTTNGVGVIADYLPDGWEHVHPGNGSTIPASPHYDGDGYLYTSNEAFFRCYGETVWGGLSKLAELTGEYFYVDVDADGTRLIRWRRGITLEANYRDTQRTLIRATGVTHENNSQVEYVSALDELEDSNEIVTRIYPYGAGNAGARLDLTHITQDDGGGGGGGGGSTWTVSVEDNYVESDIFVLADYGLIERQVSFNELEEITGTDIGLTGAADQLLQAAQVYLSARQAPVTSYTATITNPGYHFKPGDRVEVKYYEFADDKRQMEAIGYWLVSAASYSFANESNSTTLTLTDNMPGKVLYMGGTFIAKIEQAAQRDNRAQPIHDTKVVHQEGLVRGEGGKLIPLVTGGRGTNQALNTLISGLAAAGIINDRTTSSGGEP